MYTTDIPGLLNRPPCWRAPSPLKADPEYCSSTGRQTVRSAIRQDQPLAEARRTREARDLGRNPVFDAAKKAFDLPGARLQPGNLKGNFSAQAHLRAFQPGAGLLFTLENTGGLSGKGARCGRGAQTRQG